MENLLHPFCNFNNSWIWNEADIIIYLRTDIDIILPLYIRPILTAIGLLTNFAFLFVLYRIPNMRTVTNFYLANLAVADAVILVSTTGYYLWEYLSSSVYKGIVDGSTVVCKYLLNTLLFISYFAYFAAVFLVTAVSAERYLALCHPLQHRWLSTKSRAIKIVTMIWLFTIGLASPALFRFTSAPLCMFRPTDDSPIGYAFYLVTYCKTTCFSCDLFTTAFDFIQFAVALFANTAMYMLIIKVLGKNSDTDGTSLRTTRDKNRAQARRAIARMLMINGTVFFILLGPLKLKHVFDLISTYSDLSPTTPDAINILNIISYLTTFLNSCCNPLVYVFSNQRYRQAFIEAFRLRKVTATYSETDTEVRSISIDGQVNSKL